MCCERKAFEIFSRGADWKRKKQLESKKKAKTKSIGDVKLNKADLKSQIDTVHGHGYTSKEEYLAHIKNLFSAENIQKGGEWSSYQKIKNYQDLLDRRNEDMQSKQKAKRRREKRKKETREFFAQDTNSSFFTRFSQKKCITEKEDYERKEETREDFEKRECRRERCLLTTGARRRIEWKRNPSMKRSHRSPCWYELNNVFILRVVLLYDDGEERRIRQPFFCVFFVYFFFFGVMILTSFFALSLSLSVFCVTFMLKKYRRRRLCSARASSSRS